MVSPHKIKYNNVESVELPMDLVIEVSFDGDNGESSTYLNREAVASETYDGRYKRVYGYKYTESFSPRFTFTKKGFGDFTIGEVRQVLKWLTSTSQTAILNVYYTHDDAIKSADWTAIGGWTEISTYKLANNRTVGIVATFEAITPYAMSNVWSHTISEDDGYKMPITVDTDDNQPIYPRITVQQKGAIITIPSDRVLDLNSDMIENTVYCNGTTYYWKSDNPALCVGIKTPGYTGWKIENRDTTYATTDQFENKTIYYYTSDQRYRWIDPYFFKSSIENPGLATTGVKITNTHKDKDGRVLKVVSTVIKNNSSTEQIVIDGANKLISSTNTRRIFGDDFDWQWLPLFDNNMDDINEITIEGNCEAHIEYREVRKVGEY